MYTRGTLCHSTVQDGNPKQREDEGQGMKVLVYHHPCFLSLKPTQYFSYT